MGTEVAAVSCCQSWIDAEVLRKALEGQTSGRESGCYPRISQVDGSRYGWKSGDGNRVIPRKRFSALQASVGTAGRCFVWIGDGWAGQGRAGR